MRFLQWIILFWTLDVALAATTSTRRTTTSTSRRVTSTSTRKTTSVTLTRKTSTSTLRTSTLSSTRKSSTTSLLKSTSTLKTSSTLRSSSTSTSSSTSRSSSSNKPSTSTGFSISTLATSSTAAPRSSSSIPTSSTTSTSFLRSSSTSSTSSSTSPSSSPDSSTTIRSTSTSSTSSSTASSSSASASATPVANSGRRGLGFNDATLTQPFSLSGQGSKVSWAYNWASQPYYPFSETATNKYNSVLKYVPMLWSAASDLTSIWNANVQTAITKYGADSVLAFNEPDGCCWECGNSCMNVTQSVDAYRRWIQPLAGTVALGAPAVTNSLSGRMGLSYLQQFMTACVGCQVDFIPLHWYGSVLDPKSFQDYVAGAYQKFGKPIWITEFATSSGDPQQVMKFLQAVLPWLDAQSYVVRYAYFMDRAAGFPYLVETDAKNMTDIGKYYNSG